MERLKINLLVLIVIITISLIFYTVYFLLLEVSKFHSTCMYFMPNNALCFFRHYLYYNTDDHARSMSWMMVFTDCVFIAVFVSQFTRNTDPDAEHEVGRDSLICVAPATIACIFTIPLLCTIVSFTLNMISVPEGFVNFLDTQVGNRTICREHSLPYGDENMRDSVVFLYMHGLAVFSVLLLLDVCLGVYLFRKVTRHVSQVI